MPIVITLRNVGTAAIVIGLLIAMITLGTTADRPFAWPVSSSSSAPGCGWRPLFAPEMPAIRTTSPDPPPDFLPALPVPRLHESRR